LEIFSIVPTFVIEVLADEFDGGLCSVLLLLGHVEVVDENNASFADGRSVDSLAQFVQFAVDGILGLVAAGLCAEDHADVLILFAEFLGE
jgi:hypothetical protein